MRAVRAVIEPEAGFNLVALPKQYRLTQSKHFSKVHRFGRQARTQSLVVKALVAPVSPSGIPSRFGITVSQKVSKRSVVRNRLKRRVRAAIQALFSRLRPGFWVVITLRSAAVDCEYGQFLQELERLFSELEVLDGYSGRYLL